ncbi:hypothetical protein Zmor_010351 [Zophobas morio]|uniref:Uncharacterized protein n=1 Tax=Zophobas morio TaxID=2755281 RepID=A0AA38IK60_9CUCU|nr:hypothetical protein Zmor_010351 [Zophobas morio]
MELHIVVNKYDFKRRFSINVYRFVCGNQQCPEIIEEFQHVKVAAATPVFFYLSTNLLRRSDACIASQGQHFQHLKKLKVFRSFLFERFSNSVYKVAQCLRIEGSSWGFY